MAAATSGESQSSVGHTRRMISALSTPRSTQSPHQFLRGHALLFRTGPRQCLTLPPPEEFRMLPLNIRIEAYRSGMTPIPSPIQASHSAVVGKIHGAIPSSVSSPIHSRFSHEMLQASPSLKDAPPSASSNTSHNRSFSHNMLGANSNGAAPSAPVEPSRVQRQNPVLEGTDRADRTKSVNNFAFPFSFGKPIANGGLAEPQAEPKKRISQIIQHSGFSIAIPGQVSLATSAVIGRHTRRRSRARNCTSTSRHTTERLLSKVFSLLMLASSTNPLP
jgi:hypothetical protein